MTRLSSVIEQVEADFLRQYGSQMLPSQRQALAAIKTCRNKYSTLMQVHCDDCHVDKFLPIPAVIVIVPIANIMNLSNGWRTNVENRCLAIILW